MTNSRIIKNRFATKHIWGATDTTITTNNRTKTAKTLAKIAAALTMFACVNTTAQITPELIGRYATAMQNAANNQNVGQIAQFLSDDVIISLNRQGQGSVTLDKAGYLAMLQNNWQQSQNYRYRMTIDNVIIAGDTAKAHIVSTETWQKNGQKNTLTTTAKATFGQSNNNTVLLRSVAQVALD